MSTHVPGFQSAFSCLLHHFVFAKLGTRSITVKESPINTTIGGV